LTEEIAHIQPTPVTVKPESVLSIQSLKKRFGPTVALDGVDLEVGQGDIFGFLGRNGAGKSTTIKIVAGLVTPDEGQVRMLDSDRTGSLPATRRYVGFLIENPAFYPYLDAVENLSCHAMLHGGLDEGFLDQVHASLKWVGLEEAAHRKVGGYSTGMRQRLGLAQAFLGRPKLMVLDEPLNGLDPEGILHIRTLIREWADQRGTTFFISSHILAEVEQLCTRVGFVARGRIVAEGTLDELGATGWISLRTSRPEAALRLVAERWPEVQARKSSEGHLSMKLAENEIPVLVRELVEQGFDVFEVGRRPRSLEEIFMELTGGQA
jgi:ABC-2 type transport system ATP-binding protein